MLLPSVAAGGIVAFIAYLLLRRGMELDEADKKDYSEKFFSFKKKLIKATAVISVAVIIPQGMFLACSRSRIAMIPGLIPALQR